MVILVIGFVALTIRSHAYVKHHLYAWVWLLNDHMGRRLPWHVENSCQCAPTWCLAEQKYVEMTGMMTETQENPVKSSVHASFIFIYQVLYETYQVNTYIKNIKNHPKSRPLNLGTWHSSLAAQRRKRHQGPRVGQVTETWRTSSGFQRRLRGFNAPKVDEFPSYEPLPSGKLTKLWNDPPFSMGKSMKIHYKWSFSIAMLNYHWVQTSITAGYRQISNVDDEQLYVAQKECCDRLPPDQLLKNTWACANMKRYENWSEVITRLWYSRRLARHTHWQIHAV